MSFNGHGARAARGTVSASASALRLHLLAATALGASIGIVGSTQPSSAQSAPACTAAQTSGTAASNTIDLQGVSCTLPQTAYPTAANSAGTTITNNGAAAATLFQGTAGVTEVFAGRVIDGASATGIGLTAGTLQVNQSPTSGYMNTYSGQTLIQGGALITTAANVGSPNTTVVISAGGVFDLGGYAQTVKAVTLQGGTVQNGALMAPISSTGGTINGIGGSASVTAASGTTTLTGANTYTGATSISAGTLSVSSTGSVGTASQSSGAVSIASGGTLNNAGSVYVTTVNNAGTLLLTGGSFIVNNSLTNSGTLTRSTGASLNVQSGTFTNTGTVTMPMAYNGLNGGSGIIFNNNSGGVFNTQTTNANANVINNNSGASWTGDLNIASGATVNNAGTWASVSAGYVNAGTLNTTGTLNATMGGLTNSGTTNASGTITGNVTNTGVFNVVAPLSGISTFNQMSGTLNLGSSTLSVANPVNLAGGTISNGSIVGPGNSINAIVSSGGTINNVTNTGLVAVSGTTTVQGGSFPALYTAQGATVTASGGLSFSGATGTGGVGTINGNVSLGSGATIAPGTFTAAAGTSGYTVSNTGPGTLTLNGNIAFASGSILQVAATPTQASLLAVNGTATLGGGSVFIAASGTFPQPTSTGITYKILSASQGVSGTFASASTTTNYAFLTPTLSYDANDAYLTLNRNSTQLVQVVTTPNTSAVATALVTSGQGSRLLSAFTTLTPSQAQAAANSISGQPNASTQTAGQASTQVFTNFIGDRNVAGGTGASGVQVSSGAPAGTSQYAALEPSRPSPIVVATASVAPVYRVFATGFGGANYTNSQGGGAIAAENGSFYGGLMGLDYRVQPDLLIGAAAGGSTTSFVTPALGSSGSNTGFNASVFSVVSFGAAYGQSLTTFSTYSNNTARNIAGFGGLAPALEKASFGSHEIRTRAEFGRVIPIENNYGIENFKITPFTALEIAQLTTNGYSEYNAIGADNVFGLTASSKTYADVKSFLGARLEATYDIGNGMKIRPIVRLAYVHSFSPAPTITNTFQSVPAATFTVTGSSVAHNSAETKAGAELDLGHNTIIFANFEGNFSTLEQIYGGRGGIRYSW